MGIRAFLCYTGGNCNRPDFATCSILTIEKNVENTAFGLYFFNFML